MNAEKRQSVGGFRLGSKDLLVLGALLFVGILCWWQHRALGSVRDTHQTSLRQLNEMRADAVKICALRQAPQSAVARSRPNAELVGQIEHAVAAAGIERSHWHDTTPQPAVRIDNGEYTRHATRLAFRDVDLKQVVQFANALELRDPTLGISGANISNRNPESPYYDVDVAVSYLVYGPKANGREKVSAHRP